MIKMAITSLYINNGQEKSKYILLGKVMTKMEMKTKINQLNNRNKRSGIK